MKDKFPSFTSTISSEWEIDIWSWWQKISNYNKWQWQAIEYTEYTNKHQSKKKKKCLRVQISRLHFREWKIWQWDRNKMQIDTLCDLLAVATTQTSEVYIGRFGHCGNPTREISSRVGWNLEKDCWYFQKRQIWTDGIRNILHSQLQNEGIRNVLHSQLRNNGNRNIFTVRACHMKKDSFSGRDLKKGHSLLLTKWWTFLHCGHSR